MKIVFYEAEGWEEEYLKKRFPKSTSIVFTQEILTDKSANFSKDADVISSFIYSKITKKILNMLPNLKLIATRSTGFDHIDIDECKKRGIVVCNVPSYGENTVAEHTFGLMLSLSRKIHKAYEKTIKEDFDIHSLRGFDLKGKKIGVIGTGHIGQHVIRIAKGFEMNILAYDAFPNESLIKDGLNYVSLKQIFKESDILTFHIPLTPKTTHLLNKKNVSHLKKGVIIINTSRGSIIESDALTYGLEKGVIGGVGIDVIEGEEMIKEEKEILTKNFSKEKLVLLVKNKMLLKDARVIYTPHIAFNSVEAIQRIVDTTADNIKNFSSGKTSNQVI